MSQQHSQDTRHGVLLPVLSASHTVHLTFIESQSRTGTWESHVDSTVTTPTAQPSRDSLREEIDLKTSPSPQGTDAATGADDP